METTTRNVTICARIIVGTERTITLGTGPETSAQEYIAAALVKYGQCLTEIYTATISNDGPIDVRPIYRRAA